VLNSETDQKEKRAAAAAKEAERAAKAKAAESKWAHRLQQEKARELELQGVADDGGMSAETACSAAFALLALASDDSEGVRGALVQQGALRLGLRLEQHSAPRAKDDAALALARVCISTNPHMYPQSDTVCVSLVAPLLRLVRRSTHELNQFEVSGQCGRVALLSFVLVCASACGVGAVLPRTSFAGSSHGFLLPSLQATLALTNLSSLGEDVRSAVVADGGWSDMRLLLTSSNNMVQRAAIVSRAVSLSTAFCFWLRSCRLVVLCCGSR
jgi:hypothetical protein